MAAVSEYYVDPAAGDDTNDGSIGTPWATLQHALDNITASSHGDRINLKAGSSDVLAGNLDTTTYGSGTYLAPLIIQGYTSSAGDGGQGVIDMSGTNVYAPGGTGAKIKDLRFTGCTSTSTAVTIPKWGEVINCQFDDMSGTALAIYENTMVLGCRFEDIDTYGVQALGADGDHGSVIGCYFENGTKDMTAAIYSGSYSLTACDNIINIDGSTDGISLKFFGQVCNNSIFSSSGTGAGIRCNTTGESIRLWNNLIEGFSGTGGVGVEYRADAAASINNSVYNCATAYSSDAVHLTEGNETLGATPFDKSGSANYSNRLTYFAPADVGSVRGGSYGNSTRDRGAVQSSGSGGGGASATLIPVRRPYFA